MSRCSNLYQALAKASVAWWDGLGGWATHSEKCPVGEIVRDARAGQAEGHVRIIPRDDRPTIRQDGSHRDCHGGDRKPEGKLGPLSNAALDPDLSTMSLDDTFAYRQPQTNPEAVPMSPLPEPAEDRL